MLVTIYNGSPMVMQNKILLHRSLHRHRLHVEGTQTFSLTLILLSIINLTGRENKAKVE